MQGPGRERSSERMKDRLRGLLAAGAGTLVVASAVVTAPAVTAPAAASPLPPARSIIERAEAVRAQLFTEELRRGPGEENLPQLSWHAWNNWENYQYHDQVWDNSPWWHNVGYQDSQWHNWQNWHDWRNKY